MVVLASAAGLGGCAEDMRVQGSAPATGESFAGLSDPGAFHALGDGALTFASSNGTICKGQPIDPMTGGTTPITCNDGRTGELTFSGSGKALTGKGKIGKDDVTMTLSD
jgi:hypothetical protein